MSVIKHLSEYSRAVIDGKTPACEKHKWSCLRFLNDLEKRNSWRWDFNEKRAEDYYKWISCFKHRKGELVGKVKQPVDYELFVYGNIYGWIDKKDESRRFRRSYEQIPRKQAKSQDKAIQSLYEISYFGEASAEAYVAATKKDQTRYVWGEARWLYENAIYEEIRNLFSCKYDEELLQKVIKCVITDSYFARLSKDDGKKGDGGNPQFMILDEYHLHETTEYYDLGTSGQKTRKNPLLSIITTAGLELNNPCYRIEYDYVSKLLDPHNPLENERYFAIVCELDRNTTGENLKLDDGREIEPDGIIDDMESEYALLKTNIVTGYSKNVRESIRCELDEGKDKPEKMRDVKTKTFNIWVNERSATYFNLAKWAECVQELPKTEGLTTYPGFDLSSTIDLCSVAFETPIYDGCYVIRSHSFMPKEKLLQKMRTDNVPYDIWVDQGWLTITDGAEVDYSVILDYIPTEFERNKWKKGEACYDRALATWLKQELEKRSFTPLDIPQSYTGLSLATKDFRAKVLAKKIITENNPVLKWAIGNAVVRKGPSENIMLDKSRAKERIDPIAAVINCHARAMLNEIVPEPAYKKRGLRSMLD